MAATLIADGLVNPTELKKSAIQVEVASTAAEGPAKAAPETPLPVAARQRRRKGRRCLCPQGLRRLPHLRRGRPAGLGPNLYGVLGAPHGHMAGFDYSGALKDKKGPWTYDALNEWLTKPSAYAPGTKMTFAGITSAKSRADVIAYLRSLSKTPEPLPAAPATPAK